MLRRGCVLFVLLLLPLALLACGKTEAREKDEGPPKLPAPSASAPVEFDNPGANPGLYQTTGVAAATRTSQLAAKGSGILRSIKVREGDSVKAGQVLCVLDAVNASLRAQAAAADHAQAMAALEDAKRDLDRAQTLFEAGALPDQMMEKAKLSVEVAKLRVQAASVGVRAAQQGMADATLRAPFEGVITKVLSEEGQYVSVMPPSPVFILVDTSTLDVRVNVPERKLSQIKVGMPVRVYFPAVDVTREAKVDRMANVIDAATRSAEALIQIDNKDRELPAGLFARVTFPDVAAESKDRVVGDRPSGAASTEAPPSEGAR